MKPYYDHAGITIYHGDCREILPTLDPVDLVLKSRLTNSTGWDTIRHNEDATRTKKSIGREGTMAAAQGGNPVALSKTTMVNSENGDLFRGIANGNGESVETIEDSIARTGPQGNRERSVQRREAEHAVSADHREGQMLDVLNEDEARRPSQERGPSRQSPGESPNPLRELPQSAPQEVVVGAEKIICITDPPYGIDYISGHDGRLPRSIAGDDNTDLRDWIIKTWSPKAMACFATWRCVPPLRPRGCLVWHKNAGGMGDLSFPWSPTFEMIWIYGAGWKGHRGDAVLTGRTIVTWNSGAARRRHPHEKPVDILTQIMLKHTSPTILDPFMGSGTTLRAAKDLGRKAIGIEIEEKYCEIAAKRLGQEIFDFTEGQQCSQSSKR